MGTADAETAYSAAMQGINLSVSDAEQPDAAVAATIPTNSFVFKILLQFFKLNTSRWKYSKFILFSNS